MAFENNIYDKKFLFLMLIGIPLIASTNIDCGGKSFHCLNSTHFMICVDLGGGVSYTVDDFVIPCPPPTVCLRTNRFECEFPASTTLAPTTAQQSSATVEKETTTEEVIVDTLPWNTGPEQHIELSTAAVQETTTDASVIPLPSETTGYETILNTFGTESSTVITTELSEITTISDQTITSIVNESATVPSIDVIVTTTDSPLDHFISLVDSGSVASISYNFITNDNVTTTIGSYTRNGTEIFTESFATTESVIKLENEIYTTETTAVNNSDVNTEQENISVTTSVNLINASYVLVLEQDTRESSLSERSVPITEASVVLSITTDNLSRYDATTELTSTMVATAENSTDEMHTTISENVTTLVSNIVSTTENVTVSNLNETVVQDRVTEIIMRNTSNVSADSITTPTDISTKSAITPDVTDTLTNIVFGNFGSTPATENILLTTMSTLISSTESSNQSEAAESIFYLETTTTSDIWDIGVPTTRYTAQNDTANQFSEGNSGISIETTASSNVPNYEEDQNTAVDIGTTPYTVSITKLETNDIQMTTEHPSINSIIIITNETGSKNREEIIESISYVTTTLNTTQTENVLNETIVATDDFVSSTAAPIITTTTDYIGPLSNSTEMALEKTHITSMNDANLKTIKEVSSNTTELIRTTINTTTITKKATRPSDLSTSIDILLQYGSTTEKQGPVTTTPLALVTVLTNPTATENMEQSTTEAMDTSRIMEINTEETILLNGTENAEPLVNEYELSSSIKHMNSSDVVPVSNGMNITQTSEFRPVESQTNSVQSISGSAGPQTDTEQNAAGSEKSPTNTEQSHAGLAKLSTNTESQASTEQSFIAVTLSEANTEKTTAAQADTKQSTAAVTESQSNTEQSTTTVTELQSNTEQSTASGTEPQANNEKITTVVTESQPNTRQIKATQVNTEQSTAAVTESRANTDQITALLGNTEQSTAAVTESQQGVAEPTDLQATSQQGITEPTGLQDSSHKGIAEPTDLQTSSRQGIAESTGSQAATQQGITESTNSQGITESTNSQTISQHGISELKFSQVTSQQVIAEPAGSQAISQQGMPELTGLQAISLKGIADLTGSQVTTLQGISKPTFLQAISQQGIAGKTSSQSILQQSNAKITGLQAISQQGIAESTGPQVTSVQSIAALTGSQVTPLQGNANLTGSHATLEQGIAELTGLQTSSLQGIAESTGSQATLQQGIAEPTDEQATSQQDSIEPTISQATSQQGIAEPTGSETTSQQDVAELTDSQDTSLQGIAESTGSQAILQHGIAEPTDEQATSQQDGIEPTISQATSQQGIAVLPGSQDTLQQGNAEPTGSETTSQQGVAELTDSLVTSLQGVADSTDAQATLQQGITAKSPGSQATSRQGIVEPTGAQATSQQNIAKSTGLEATLLQRISLQMNSGPTGAQANATQSITGSSGSQVTFEGPTRQDGVQASTRQNITAFSGSQGNSTNILQNDASDSDKNKTTQLTQIGDREQIRPPKNSRPNITINVTQSKQNGSLTNMEQNKQLENEKDVSSSVLQITNDTITVSQKDHAPTKFVGVVEKTFNADKQFSTHTPSILTTNLVQNGKLLPSIHNYQDTFDGSLLTTTKLPHKEVADTAGIIVLSEITTDSDLKPEGNVPMVTLLDSSYTTTPQTMIENNILVSNNVPSSANTNTESVTEALHYDKYDNKQYNILSATTSSYIRKLSEYTQQNSQVTKESKVSQDRIQNGKSTTLTANLPVITSTPFDIGEVSEVTTSSYVPVTSTTNNPSVIEVSTVTTTTISTDQLERTAFTIGDNSTAKSSTASSVTSDDNKASKPQFDCQGRPSGRYADNDECSKFYICSGTAQTIVGSCPINTVFSNIKKQCTRNLSHCIRNNEFKCTSPGRFADYLKPNVYYICMRKDQSFLRYKLQCQKDYLLNRLTVTCYKYTQPSSQSTSNDNSQSTNEKVSQEKEVEKSIIDKETHVFECEDEGKFADPNNCRGYYICKLKNKSEETYRRKHKKCDQDEVFHKEKKKCVDASSSYECRYCDSMSPNIYYVRVNRGHHFITYKFQCQNKYYLNTIRIRCETKTESSSQSESRDISKSISEGVSQAKKNLNRYKNRKTFECQEEGKFSDPNDCRRYYICKRKSNSRNSEARFRRKHKNCDSHKVFNEKKQRCTYLFQK